MNYITLVKQFWQLRREVPFSSVEADLYFYLLEISNGLQWKNPFQQSNALIAATLGVSEKTLIAARNRLKQHALIDFTPGVKRTPSTYRLLLLKSSISLNSLEILQGIREQCDSESGSESGSKSDSVSGTNTPDIIKHKLNKTKGKTANAVPKGETSQDSDLEMQGSDSNRDQSGEEVNSTSKPDSPTPEPAPPGKKGSKGRATGQVADLPLTDRYPDQVAQLDDDARSTWDRFVAWEQNNPLPKLFAMQEPLLPAQVVALIHKHGSGVVTGVLQDMQNKPRLLADYESANLTAQSWLRRRQQQEKGALRPA